jgi:O-antigen ligase
VALLESLLGLAQFNTLRTTGGAATGTYVNRNHFAGLLEMALPIAVALAVAAWRKGTLQSSQTAGPALRMTFLLASSACLLAGVVASLSRMGFVSILAGAGFTMLIVALVRNETVRDGDPWRRGWRWGAPILVPFAMIVLLPTRTLILRFADTASTQEASMHDRVEIWHDTLKLIGAYKWTGCGLGAYGHCFYPYQTAVPVRTVDFAHNDYLQILAELGIPGGLLAAVLVGWIVMRTLAVVLWNRAARNWELAVGLMASLVTLAVHSLADFNLYIPANALVFAWLSGVAVSPSLGRR